MDSLTRDQLADFVAKLPVSPLRAVLLQVLPLVRRIRAAVRSAAGAVAVIDPPSDPPDLAGGGDGDNLDAEPDWIPDSAGETYERVARWSGPMELWALAERLAATHPIPIPGGAGTSAGSHPPVEPITARSQNGPEMGFGDGIRFAMPS